MEIAAAYIRVSTTEQAEYSPESQLRLIHDYAEKNGLLLPEEFVFQDDGISGRTAAARPGFLRMIALAKRKPRPFSVILLWRFSRFARSREDSVVYKSLLRRQCGIEVVSVGEPLGTDKNALLIEALIEAMDEYYSLNLSEEVRRGLGEKRRRGEAITPPAFGYKMIEGRLCPDQNAPIVREMFAAAAAGNNPLAIAQRLSLQGHKTLRGRPFDARAVRYILQNPLYCGYLRQREGASWREYKGIHLPLVQEALFRQVSNELAYATPLRTPPAPEGFPLLGLLRCSVCGGRITRAGGGRLQCAAYAKGLCKSSHSVSEAAILSRVKARVLCDLCDWEGGSPLAMRYQERLVHAFLGKWLSQALSQRLCQLVGKIVYNRREDCVELYYWG